MVSRYLLYIKSSDYLIYPKYGFLYFHIEDIRINPFVICHKDVWIRVYIGITLCLYIFRAPSQIVLWSS